MRQLLKLDAYTRCFLLLRQEKIRQLARIKYYENHVHIENYNIIEKKKNIKKIKHPLHNIP